MADEKMIPLAAKLDDEAPYFAVVLVPGWEERPMSGRLAVVGLGPGDPRYLTPEAADALAAREALYGYGPYLDRVPARAGQSRHASDNREEGARAAAALRHAAQGAQVAVVSGGDPGVFAMAAAICEADRSRAGQPGARSMSFSFPASPRCSPSRRKSARRSATISARCRCPTISSRGIWSSAGSMPPRAPALSSRSTIRCRGRGRGSSAMRSSGCAGTCRAATPVVFGRAVGRPDEAVNVTTLGEADAAPADMATLVIVGTRETRVIARPGRSPLVYTPRAAAEVSA